MGDFQYRGPLSEQEVVEIFAKEGIEYQTRSERYYNLKDTLFENVSGDYYIAYNDTIETGKPIAVQGIGRYEGVYVLLGLKSYGKSYAGELDRSETAGAGLAVSQKVLGLHGDKPIIGLALPTGVSTFKRQGFTQIPVEDGRVVNNEDLPEDIIDVIEMLHAKEGTTTTPIRKLFYKSPVSWFALLKVKC